MTIGWIILFTVVYSGPDISVNQTYDAGKRYTMYKSLEACEEDLAARALKKDDGNYIPDEPAVWVLKREQLTNNLVASMKYKGVTMFRNCVEIHK